MKLCLFESQKKGQETCHQRHAVWLRCSSGSAVSGAPVNIPRPVLSSLSDIQPERQSDQNQDNRTETVYPPLLTPHWKLQTPSSIHHPPREAVTHRWMLQPHWPNCMCLLEAQYGANESPLPIQIWKCLDPFRSVTHCCMAGKPGPHTNDGGKTAPTVTAWGVYWASPAGTGSLTQHSWSEHSHPACALPPRSNDGRIP